MSNRHAILLSGFARDYEKTIDLFRKNLRYQNKVDLFICFWDYHGVRKFSEDSSIVKKDGSHQVVCLDRDDGMLRFDKVVEDYNPTKIKICDLDNTTSIIEPLAKIIEDTNATPSGLKSHYQITRDALMFFMFREVFSLMRDYERENNFTYTNLVRARTDFVQGGTYPKVDWNKDYSDAIYVGSWNWSGIPGYRLNDHFAVSNRENMKAYFNFYNNMNIATKKFITNELNSTWDNGRKTKAWSPEHMMSIYFSELGIKWKPI